MRLADNMGCENHLQTAATMVEIAFQVLLVGLPTAASHQHPLWQSINIIAYKRFYLLKAWCALRNVVDTVETGVACQQRIVDTMRAQQVKRLLVLHKDECETLS